MERQERVDKRDAYGRGEVKEGIKGTETEDKQMHLWRVRLSWRPVHSVMIEYKITPPVPCMLVCVYCFLSPSIFFFGLVSLPPLLSSL